MGSAGRQGERPVGCWGGRREGAAVEFVSPEMMEKRGRSLPAFVRLKPQRRGFLSAEGMEAREEKSGEVALVGGGRSWWRPYSGGVVVSEGSRTQEGAQRWREGTRREEMGGGFRGFGISGAAAESDGVAGVVVRRRRRMRQRGREVGGVGLGEDDEKRVWKKSLMEKEEGLLGFGGFNSQRPFYNREERDRTRERERGGRNLERDRDRER